MRQTEALLHPRSPQNAICQRDIEVSCKHCVITSSGQSLQSMFRVFVASLHALFHKKEGMFKVTFPLRSPPCRFTYLNCDDILATPQGSIYWIVSMLILRKLCLIRDSVRINYKIHKRFEDD